MIKILLKDRTTGKNILWANAEFGAKEIQPEEIFLIKPRREKIREEQKQRTRDRAEIFTPPEICKLQNDLFVDEKNWQEFIGAKFLEITCGEAPYIAGRYNVVTGATIAFENRGGILDRKLQIIARETKTFHDRKNFLLLAVKSVYGYEFQGDNLFLARKNIFETVAEFLTEKTPAKEFKKILAEVAEIISWNFWQMDGLTNSPPFTEEKNLFGGANCLIKNWSTGEIFEFGELLRGGRR